MHFPGGPDGAESRTSVTSPCRLHVPLSPADRLRSPHATDHARGHKALKDEFDHLWRVRRPEVTRAVSEAAAMGDRSENAEYIYGKKLLREIDRRVRFLMKRLEVLKVVDQKPADPSRIFFGAWVEVEEADSGEVLAAAHCRPR